MASCLLVRLSGSEITLLIYSFIVSLSLTRAPSHKEPQALCLPGSPVPGTFQ